MWIDELIEKLTTIQNSNKGLKLKVVGLHCDIDEPTEHDYNNLRACYSSDEVQAYRDGIVLGVPCVVLTYDG